MPVLNTSVSQEKNADINCLDLRSQAHDSRAILPEEWLLNAARFDLDQREQGKQRHEKMQNLERLIVDE